MQTNFHRSYQNHTDLGLLMSNGVLFDFINPADALELANIIAILAKRDFCQHGSI